MKCERILLKVYTRWIDSFSTLTDILNPKHGCEETGLSLKATFLPGPFREATRSGHQDGVAGIGNVLPRNGRHKHWRVSTGSVFLTVGLLLLLTSSLYAQTCGCADAPLMSSLDASATPAGSWQFGLTYQYNLIDDIVSGSRELNDTTSERSAQTLLFEVSYGFSQVWSLTGMIATIEHERRNRLSGGVSTENTITTRGVGDGLVLLKYNVIGARTGSSSEFTLGGGLKIPLGKTDLTSQGITLAEDMQPGTGSWDGIFWGYFSQNAFPTTSMNVFLTASYRLTGTNNRDYRFGNEFMTTLGFRHQAWRRFDYSLALRYRTTDANRRSNAELPNTGGKWLYLVPGLNIRLNDHFSLRFSGLIPVDRNLNGTQLTNSLTASVSLFYLSK